MLKILATFSIIFISFLIYDFLSIETDDGCLWDLENSKKQVYEYLSKNNMPLKYLSIPEYNYNICAIEFSYVSAGENYDFLAIESAITGVNLSIMRNKVSK